MITIKDRKLEGAYLTKEYVGVFDDLLTPSFGLEEEDGNGKHDDPSEDLIETETEVEVETPKEEAPSNGGHESNLKKLQEKLRLWKEQKLQTEGVNTYI
jgi:hypothetical protein